MITKFVFALVGLIAFATLVGTNDPGAIARAVVSVGAIGFAALVAWQLLLYAPLGAAWRRVAGGGALGRFAWARAVREGAANFLPFSVVGGIVFGARALARTGGAGTAAAAGAGFGGAVATSIVDVTLEFVAQVGFAAAALACLAFARPGASILLPSLVTLAVAAAIAAAAVGGQARLGGLIRSLAARIGRPFAAQPGTGGATGNTGDVPALIGRLYADRRGLAAGIALHLAAWFGSAASLWLTLRLIGRPIRFDAAVAIEGLVCLARAVAFPLPAGLGVQEAGYLTLGALYGVGAEAAMAVSLLRRAREAAIGLPALLVATWPARGVAGVSVAGRTPRGLVVGSLALANRLLERFHVWTGAPSAEAALAAVAAEPGRAALDDPALREALDQWTRSLRHEADLNPVGRYGAQWDVVRLLRIQCRLAEEEARDPAIRAAPIVAPIFITGMPRSGSTFLHGVLAQDPANQVPRCWQALAPYPPRTGRDRREAEARFQLGMFNRMSPGLAALHPLAVETPQECSELMAASFRSLRFDTTHHVPSYRRWLDQAGYVPAYAFLKRMLQHLQHQDQAVAGRDRTGQGRQWVLKCPDHVFAIDALLEVFPDARFVVMHRDPLKVLPSATTLTALLRRPFTRAIDRPALGRHVVRDWLDGAERIVAMADRLPDDRLLHIHYREISRRPLETVRRLYARFGLEMAPGAEAAIEAYCLRPRGGYGDNRYHLSDFAIDPVATRRQFQFYMDRFDVEQEVGVNDGDDTALARSAA